MTFKLDILEDRLSVFLNTDDFAEAIIYTDNDGLQSSIVAIIDRQGNMDIEVRGLGTETEASAVAWISVADIPDPRYHDTVLILKPSDDGVVPNDPDEEETWEVRDVRGGDYGMWELGLRRDVRVEY